MLLTEKRIIEILEKIKNVRVAVYGDFCLDAYWILDPEGSEISVETGLKAQAVQKHYYSPGGAANIVANLAALEPAKIKVIGIIGDDLFGRELSSQISAMDVDISSLFIQKQQFDTCAFTKRYLENVEEPRIDFGVFNKRTKDSDKRILDEIRNALIQFDVLIFNQQVPGSITNSEFIDNSNELFYQFRDKLIFLDSRNYNERFENVIRKTNEIELARLIGLEVSPEEYIPISTVIRYGNEAYRKYNKPLFVTCGERGIVAFDENGIHTVYGLNFLKQLDTVGAGDTVLSSLALCMAAGVCAFEAAEFANLAAGITVQKLFTTGTASGNEIINMGRNPDFIYNVDLSEDVGMARYIPGTQIEICDEIDRKNRPSIKHVIFDHDGTISTLRAGWESIMEKTMFQCITGSMEQAEDSPLQKRIRNRINEFIDKSTGVQTSIQMQGLVEMVEEFGLVPPADRRDAFGYKKIYNDGLMEMIDRRLQMIGSGKLDKNNFIIPGIIDLLEILKEKGTVLYLASGTDIEDVKKEAAYLGYDHYFNDRIFGSVSDITKYSKRRLIEQIINENNLTKYEFTVFGDGPVEIRECRKKGGIAFGIASDENNFNRLNLFKRARLIKAGSHFIIQNFSESEALKRILFDNVD